MSQTRASSHTPVRHHHDLHLPPPADLATAAPTELATLLPHCYEICSFRNRSFESRGMVVRYHPQVSADTQQCSLHLDWPAAARP
jgi:hypothetical protein